MADIRKLIVAVIGDTSSLERAFKRTEAETKTLGTRMSSLGKAAAITAGGVGLGALIVAAKRGFDEFKEGEKVAAQTAAVLKSTGAAAGITANQISNLATQISNFSGIDDEAVQSTENLLLTFTNIKNVGKQRIFDQATRSAVDMSVALGQDLKSSAIQVGKALNDPVKGITALQRVGVTFTKQQRDQIKALVSSGKTMAAQKVILRELNKEFGGSAKAAGSTLTGSLQRVRNALDNIAGSIVSGAAPAIERVSDRFAKWLANSKNQARILHDVSSAVKAVTAVAKVLKEAFDIALPAIRLVFRLMRASVLVAAAPLRVIIGILKGDWAAAWRGIVAPVKAAWDLVKGIVLRSVLFIVDLLSKIPTSFKVLGRRIGFKNPFIGLADSLRGQIAKSQGIAAAGGKALGRSIATGISAGVVEALPAGVLGPVGKPGKPSDGRPPGLQGPVGTPPKPPKPVRRLTATELARRGLLAAQGTLGTKDDVPALRALIGALTKKLAGTQNLAARKKIVDEIGILNSELESLTKSTDEATKTTKRTTAKVTAAQRASQQFAAARRKSFAFSPAKLAASRQAEQFRALGLTATGDQPIASAKQINSRLGRISQAVKGTFLDTAKTRGLLSNLRKVLSGSLGAVGRDVRARIQEILDGINDQLKEHASTQTRFKRANQKALLSGLGLDAETERIIRARFSQIGLGGTAPGKGVGAFGVNVAGAAGGPQRPPDVVVNLTNTLDGKAIGKSTTRHQQTFKRRNPPQRRGRFAGGTI